MVQIPTDYVIQLHYGALSNPNLYLDKTIKNGWCHQLEAMPDTQLTVLLQPG